MPMLAPQWICSPATSTGSHSVGDQPLRKRLGILPSPRLRLNDGELVSSQAGNGVVLTNGFAHATRDFAQQGISRRVSQGIVHQLEVVEVDAQKRQVAPGSPRRRKRLLQAVGQQRTVGQTRERIMLCQEAYPPLRFDLAGDVAPDAAVTREVAAFVEDRPAADLGDAPVTRRHPDRRR